MSTQATAWVFTLSLTVYLLTTVAIRREIQPTGDEPHYLLYAHSLVNDHDFDLLNNYLNEDYRGFYNGDLKADLNRHAFDYHGDEHYYSIHPIGVPVLLLLPYRLAGYFGVFAAVVLAFAIASTIAFRWAYAASASTIASTLAWSAIFLTNPLLSNSSQVYPDSFASLFVLVPAYLLFSSDRCSTGRSFVAGSFVGFLPLLSPRYAPLALLLLAFGIWRVNVTRIRRVALALLSPAVVLFLGVLATQWFLYGSPVPSAAYNQFGYSLFAIQLLSQSLPGLWFDQQYGLFVIAPVYLVILPVWFVQALRADRQVRQISIVGILFFLLTLALLAPCVCWYGGPLPNRYLVPVLPFAIIPVATFLADNHIRQKLRLGVTLAMIGLLLPSLWLAYETARYPTPYFTIGGGVTDYWASIGSPVTHVLDLLPRFKLPLARLSYTGKDLLSQTGELWSAPDASITKVRRAVPDRDAPGFLVYGPYVRLPQGKYTACFSIRREEAVPGVLVARLDIGSQFGPLEKQHAYAAYAGQAITSATLAEGDYDDVCLDFVTPGHEAIETRVYFTGSTVLSVTEVDIQRQPD